MGNALGGRKKRAKVMKVDGSVFKVKPQAHAMDVLRDHPGHALLDAERFQRVGLRGRPLDPDAPLKPGKLYFLVELHRLRGQGRGPSCRAAWSGELRMGASERLETLRLSRRTLSDLSSQANWSAAAAVETEEITKDGTLRLKMRLPKAQVERLMRESKDAAEAAQKIMQLCAAKDDGGDRRRSTSVPEPPGRNERQRQRLQPCRRKVRKAAASAAAAAVANSEALLSMLPKAVRQLRKLLLLATPSRHLCLEHLLLARCDLGLPNDFEQSDELLSLTVEKR